MQEPKNEKKDKLTKAWTFIW